LFPPEVRRGLPLTATGSALRNGALSPFPPISAGRSPSRSQGRRGRLHPLSKYLGLPDERGTLPLRAPSRGAPHAAFPHPSPAPPPLVPSVGLVAPSASRADDWSVACGGHNARDGRSAEFGPTAAQILWQGGRSALANRQACAAGNVLATGRLNQFGQAGGLI